MSVGKGIICVVVDKHNGEKRLVLASTKTSARNHVVKDRFEVEKADSVTIQALTASGVQIESVMEEDALKAISKMTEGAKIDKDEHL